MANSNKVFVSPGVYTSEKDLTFVAQSVGVTTLGLVGETLKGPAFEPILIGDFDEFKIRFGSTSPEKFGGTQKNPKYELPYVAKSYLQESNQLFVTRVLGLTGYLPKNTYCIKTLGTITHETGNTASDVSSTYRTFLSGKTSIDGVHSITELIDTNYLRLTIGTYFSIGPVPFSQYPVISGLTGTSITGPNGDFTNFVWANKFYEPSNGSLSSYLFISTGAGFNVTKFNYSGVTANNYDGLTVAALRSRGNYGAGDLLSLKVTGTGSTVTISGSTATNNPYGEFSLNLTTDDGKQKSFKCSLDSSSKQSISKVIGTDVFDKDKDLYPLYVYESYPNLIKSLTDRGLIRGLSTGITTHDNTVDFLVGWDTTMSPMVVSEVRGGNVSDLFQVITISDGNNANTEVKITIANINLDSGEFDLLVRDYYDTDDNMSVLEKFTRCSMNPEINGYVGLKIGTSDTVYKLRSKYIMLNMADNHPTDAIPAGFKGFTCNTFNSSELGNVLYKTQYYNAGDIVLYDALGNEILESGDKVRKVSLGLSTKVGYDDDLLKYKGLNAGNKTTQGFHLSVNAGLITGSTITNYEYDVTPYDLEGDDKGKLNDIAYRKFTFAICGGFDGWDIYRDQRTNIDNYIFGKKPYVNNNQTNLGVFNDDIGNSDYYAYLEGINTFSNPEAVDINVFATPGINFHDHSSLVTQTIDMIENERADSLYIIGSPNKSDVDSIVNDLDIVALDSNYSATYWPWIQVRDNDNSTQLFIPPTGEVVKNIALTDNVSYPWFAVAGYSRGLVNSVKAVKKLTLDERDSLYKSRINPIATFSDTGTIIWGNKTLQTKESALDRINVRRLLLRTRKLISAVSVRLLFEQNDDQVRQDFLRLVNPILESIKKERGLYDFRVTVSNAPEDIDANTLRGKIYIKPTRSLEYIDLEFVVTPTGASFENV